MTQYITRDIHWGGPIKWIRRLVGRTVCGKRIADLNRPSRGNCGKRRGGPRSAVPGILGQSSVARGSGGWRPCFCVGSRTGNIGLPQKTNSGTGYVFPHRPPLSPRQLSAELDLVRGPKWRTEMPTANGRQPDWFDSCFPLPLSAVEAAPSSSYRWCCSM